MLIEVKSSCYFCPFLIKERMERTNYYSCDRGAFGYSETRPSKTEVPNNCPLLKENIIVKLIKK